MVIDVKTQRSIDIVLDQFTQSRFTADEPFRAADHIVTVRKQPGLVGWRIGGDVKDMPYILSDREGGPLEGYTQSWVLSRDWNVDLPDFLALIVLDRIRLNSSHRRC